MSNPWEKLKLEHYEGHMQYENVYQAQMLNSIMNKQINELPAKTICILGISGGNGLEHVNIDRISKIIGIDINIEYLSACRSRFPALNDILDLVHTDLTLPCSKIPDMEIIIANLVIEYLGIDIFKNLMEKNKSKYLSCVIQQSCNNSFVSSTPFDKYFSDISHVHNDIDKERLIQVLKSIGLHPTLIEEIEMPNNKILLRMDFKRM